MGGEENGGRQELECLQKNYKSAKKMQNKPSKMNLAPWCYEWDGKMD